MDSVLSAPGVCRVTTDEQQKQAELVLVDAFEHDTFLRNVSWTVRYTVAYCRRYGMVLLASEEGDTGAALCLLPPGETEEAEKSLPLLQTLGTPLDDFGSSSSEAVKRMHEEIMGERAHWHLWMLGSTSKARGKGFASRLVRCLNALADQNGEQVYLETDKESSRDFYARLGFSVEKTFPVKDGVFFGMRRPVHQSKHVDLELFASFQMANSEYLKQLLPEYLISSFKQHSERVAATHGDESITYGELLEKRIGISKGQRVAILADSGIDFLVALVSVVTQGGAFVPIDPKLPLERVEFILKDSAAEIVMAQRIHQDLLGNFTGRIMIFEDQPDVHSPISDSITVSPDDLAYIIYTSGTTGDPKGVLVPQKGLLNMLLSVNEIVQVVPSDVCFHFYGLGFDGTIVNVFLPLIVGATLKCRLNSNYFEQLESASVGFLTPSALSAAIDSDSIPKSLLKVLVGGEAISQELVVRASAICNVYNIYGPSECTVISSIEHFNRQTNKVITVGSPIPNVEYRIVSRFDSSVVLPLGGVGELLIGGVGVASGYLNHPVKTAKAFQNGLYRTGDLGKWLPDGRVQLFGRIDSQIKMRGFRIELGEIESACLKCRGVSEACVVYHDERLYGFLVASASVSTVREFLERKLPPYMVPGDILLLESFPRTLSDKVDRKELIRRLQRQPAPAVLSSSPSTLSQKESIVANAFALALKQPLSRINCTDDFFDMGGTSLQAFQLLSFLKKRGVELNLLELFELRTVQRIANKIQSNSNVSEHTLERVGTSGPMSASQQTLFAIQAQAKDCSYNINLHLEIKGKRKAVETAVNVVMNRHNVFRTRFTLGMQQIIDDSMPFESVWDDSMTSERSLAHVFDLSKECATCHLAELSRDTIAVFLTVHHIVFDGISASIIERELKLALAGQTLPDLQSQFIDFCAAERVKLFAPEPSVSLTALERNLCDDEREKMTLIVTDLILPNLASKFTDTSISATLIGALGVVLAGESNYVAERFYIGSVFANRNQFTECQDMIGYFASSVPILIHVDRFRSFADVCQTAQESLIGQMSENKTISFDLNLFQVFFSLLEREAGEGKASQVSPLKGASEPPVKFQLELEAIVNREDGSILLRYMFDSRYYSAETVQSISSKIHLLLEEVFVAQPDARCNQAVFALSLEPLVPLTVAAEEAGETIAQFSLRASAIQNVHLHVIRTAVPAQIELLATQRFRGNVLEESNKLTELSLVDSILIYIVEESETRIGILITAHPRVADFASLNLLLEDGVSTEMTFDSYAVWEGKQYQGSRLKEALNFYSLLLSGAPTLVDIPTDFLRPPEKRAYGCKRRSLNVGSEFEFYAAVAKVFGAHSINQDALVLGVVVPNRAIAPSVFGPLKNVVPVKAELHLSDKALQDSIKLQLRECLPYCGLPIDLLAGVLDESAGLNHSPLIQVAVHFRQVVDGEIETPGEGIHCAEISLELKGTVLSVYFHENLYRDDSIELLMNHLVSVIETGEIKPELTLLNGFNFPAPSSVGGDFLYSQLDSVNPELIAILYENKEMTYGELQKRTLQAAARLQREGVVPGDFVGILMKRSPDFIISELAILKCGAAFVPMDEKYPASRIQYIMNDAQCKAVICDRNIDSFDGKIIRKDNLYELDAAQFSQPENICTSDLAYMIYTSGSTGNPKGVELRHESVVAYIRFWRNATNIESSDTNMWFSGCAFDASIEEKYGTLSAGASLLIRTEDWLDEIQKCTFFASTPSALAALDPIDYPRLRCVIVGGEALPIPLMRLWRSRVTLFNSYGPTECAVAATLANCSLFDETDCDVTIGRPNPGLTAYVLDENLEVLPIGIVGQLAFSGTQVGAGYHNLAEKTAKAFIVHPTLKVRMYLTGDLARWLPRGELAYHGRLDQQVKIRGYRIELSSIESVIGSFEGVSGVTVTVLNPGLPHAALCAYVSPENVDSKALREYCRQELPNFMVPAHFLLISELPLTANGKIDRKALPVPNKQSKVSSFCELMTPMQSLIASVLSEVLNIGKDDSPLGLDDRFFERGGNSISALRFAHILKKTHDIIVDVTLIVTLQTVRAMGKRLSSSSSSSTESLSEFDLNAPNRGVEVVPDLLVPLYTNLSASPNAASVVLFPGFNGALGPMRYVSKQLERTASPLIASVQGLHLAPHVKVQSTWQLAAALAAAVRHANDGERPLVLVGVQFGNLLALEAARMLRRAGETVLGVVLVGEYFAEKDLDVFSSLLQCSSATHEQMRKLSVEQRQAHVLKELSGFSAHDLKRHTETWELLEGLGNVYFESMASIVDEVPKSIACVTTGERRKTMWPFENMQLVSVEASSRFRILKECSRDVAETIESIISDSGVAGSIMGGEIDFLTMSSTIDRFVDGMGDLFSSPFPQSSASLHQSPLETTLDLRSSLLGLSNMNQTFASLDLDAESAAPLDFLNRFKPLKAHTLLDCEKEEEFLLTGATGFLGPFLVRAILSLSPTSRVVCIVRAKSDAEARNRVVEALREDLKFEFDPSRLVVFAGDLSLPHFGLGSRQWNNLTQSVSFVVHNGAQVNHLLDYKSLKNANVGGAKTALRFACQGKTKRMVLVTTVGTAKSDKAKNVVFETDCSLDSATAALETGYVSTKWVAEKLLARCVAKGLSGTIVRPAMIGWSEAGVFNPHDWLVGALRSVAKVGAIPISHSCISLAPVEFVASAVLAPLFSADAPEVINVANPVWCRFSEMFDAFDRVLNKLLPRVPFKRWIHLCGEFSEDPAVSSTLLLLSHLDDFPGELRYDVTQCQRVLKECGTPLPGKLSADYFDAVVKRIVGLK